MAKNELTLDQVIASVRKRLPNYQGRIVDKADNFACIWWPDNPWEESTGNFQQQLMSDYGVLPNSGQVAEVAREYNDEMGALYECLRQSGFAGLDWQRPASELSEEEL